jgi:hypothetical protein
VFQQAVSALTQTDQQAYELSGGGFSVYGFEYKPGADDAVCSLSHATSAGLSFRQYITWISDNKASWTLLSAAMGSDSTVEIAERPIPQEPMVCRLGGWNPPY